MENGLKGYESLDFKEKLRVNLIIRRLKKKGYGSKKIVKVLRDEHKIQIGRTTVRNIINQKTSISRIPEEFLEDALKSCTSFKREYKNLNREERQKLRENFDRLCSMGCGPYIAARILELKHCVKLTTGLISGWYYRGSLPQGKHSTKLTPPTKELAIIAATRISDGSLENLKKISRKRFRLQMKDIEPVEHFTEQLIRITDRLGYTISYNEYNQTFEVKTYRRDLIDYIQDEDNIIKLLKLYPEDSLKMLFEADGGVSGSISTTHSKKRIRFQPFVYLTSSKKWLLNEVSDLLNEIGIKSRVRLNVKAGTIHRIRGREVVTKKDCYVLSITEKDSIVRYSEKIGFISKRKQEKLVDVVDILKKYGSTLEAAVEWVRRYKYYRRGKERWIKRELVLTYKEAISELSKLLRERPKKQNKLAVADHIHHH